MKQIKENLVDRYLHPDQVIFGHLFNPNMKCAHNYELSKSSQQVQENDQLFIYQKQLSQTKIKSMLNMMQGKQQPLFKSSLGKVQQHIHKDHLKQGSQEDYEDQYEDQQDDGYDDEMYLMEKDYEDYFQDQYDQEENPIMAFGKSIGTLPRGNNYAKQLNFSSKQQRSQNENIKLFQSDAYGARLKNNKKQEGLGEILGKRISAKDELLGQVQGQGRVEQKEMKLSTKLKQSKKSSQKKAQKKNESDEDWQTESQEQI